MWIKKKQCTLDLKYSNISMKFCLATLLGPNFSPSCYLAWSLTAGPGSPAMPLKPRCPFMPLSPVSPASPLSPRAPAGP